KKSKSRKVDKDKMDKETREMAGDTWCYPSRGAYAKYIRYFKVILTFIDYNGTFVARYANLMEWSGGEQSKIKMVNNGVLTTTTTWKNTDESMRHCQKFFLILSSGQQGPEE
ncbi:hypothetical protein Tsubulata_013616, partial [Turnera subulata]